MTTGAAPACSVATIPTSSPPGRRSAEVLRKNSHFGPVDPAVETGYDDPPPRKGFFTDTSVCIGCKACEVACKEWNDVPDEGFDLLGMSYDNTGSLNANPWRPAAFIEPPRPGGRRGWATDLGMTPSRPPGDAADAQDVQCSKDMGFR